MSEPNFEELLSELDHRNMAGFTRKFVDDLSASMSTELDLVEDSDWNGVLCLGMGGSGAGGLFLRALSDDSGGLPFVVWTDYGVPSWWGPEWLVIATSYSGNTEETLDGVREVISAGGTVVGICSGGELEGILSGDDNSVCLNVPSGQMPRSAFGHIFGTQLSACWELGILPRPSSEELSSMLDRLSHASLESDLSDNSGMAATLSRSIVGSEIGIVAPTCLGPAAYRFSCQLNENSAMFAGVTDVPEMNHNEIVAWTSKTASNRALLLFSCEDLHPRTSARIDWMLKEIESYPSWVIECEGESLLERLLYAAHVTDWVSIGLAVLTGEDPSEMPAIESLKAHLASIQ
ncbi:MAG: SIS domain-containing protein [Candidatus Thermoplasmatota archaeon]|nr:SIS domain-containing protein [Candidatus Thermoplasmatota archaeon]